MMQPHLNFADLLRIQTGSVEDAFAESPTLGVIPPTPQDLWTSGDFMQFAEFANLTYQDTSLSSPPPIETGIVTQPANSTLVRGHARSESLEAPKDAFTLNSRPQHARTRSHPYQHSSRQSSISSSANGTIDSDLTSDWQWETRTPGHSASVSRSNSPGNGSGCIDGAALLSMCPEGAQSVQSDDFAQPTPGSQQAVSDQSQYARDGAGPCAQESRSYQPVQLRATATQADMQPQVRNATPSLHHIHRERDSLALNRSRRQITRRQSPPPLTPPKKATAGGGRGRVEDGADEPILVTAITKSGKKSHARKRPIGHVPRPRNAFILFRKHVVDSNIIPPHVESRHQNISVTVAKLWAQADQATKARFQEEARLEKERHQQEHPDYKYQPVYRRESAPRRKAKVDPIEDKKCDVLAQLVLQGKSGDALHEEAKTEVEAVAQRRRTEKARLMSAQATRSSRQVLKGKEQGRAVRHLNVQDGSVREVIEGDSAPSSDYADEWRSETDEEDLAGQGNGGTMPQLAINGRPFDYNQSTPALTYAESSQAATTGTVTTGGVASGLQSTTQWSAGNEWMLPMVQQGVTFMPGPPPLDMSYQDGNGFAHWNAFTGYSGGQQQNMTGPGLGCGFDTLQPAMLVQQMHDDLEGLDYSQPLNDFMGTDLFAADAAMADYQQAMGQVIERNTFG